MGMVAAENMETWIKDWLSAELKVPASDLGGGKSFVSYGVDSVMAMMLIGDLEDTLKRRLPPTLSWDYPTVEALAAYLSSLPVSLAVAPPQSTHAHLLASLDDLSEEEIDRLLEEQIEAVAHGAP